MNAKNVIFWIIFIIVIILIVLYIIYYKIKNKIINEMEDFLKKVGIIENKDIIFNTDKKKLLYDVFKGGNLAFGESYMKGNWDSPDIFNLFVKILENRSYNKYEYGSELFKNMTKNLSYGQTSGLEMVNKHYNLGNDFFVKWLDKNMQYSCGYWNKPNMTLDEAQIAKMNLIGRKLKLRKGMDVLDIGSGWGTLSGYLSNTFGVNVVGISLSIEQIKYAKEKYGKNNPNITFIYGDFGDILNYGKKFDRVLSVGFYEHVGNDRYNEFFDITNKVMKDDGISLLHTIGSNNKNKGSDQWIKKYIFTRGVIPSFSGITSHAQANDLVIEDVQNFGFDYYKTLMAWYNNFKRNCSDLKTKDPIFYRMWEYYLCTCCAAFYCRELFLWQIILTKKKCINKKYIGDR